MMNPFISPSKSDTDPKGHVQSVAEKGRKNMGPSVAWQPAGGIIAGTDEVDNKHRVIFWEKNGLRHLEFELLHIVKKVNELFWSPDSSVLYVDCETDSSRVLYFYYRSNYKWHLKHQVLLTAE
jgi:elongator complex protein 1